MRQYHAPTIGLLVLVSAILACSFQTATPGVVPPPTAAGGTAMPAQPTGTELLSTFTIVPQLPQDVPIYPGAQVQNVANGMTIFLVDADINTVKAFYKKQLPAAGWTADGQPVDLSSNYMSKWKKNNLKLAVIIATEASTRTSISINLQSMGGNVYAVTPNSSPITVKTRTSPIDGMLEDFVPSGQFIMGAPRDVNDEDHLHALVYLDAYWIDQTEVTNAMFTKFVAATNYVTNAQNNGWGFVNNATNDGYNKGSGADWQHPQGSASSITGKDNDPVTQVSWNDAVAYCMWAGRRLPTEAEWEKAARGTDGRNYPWGNEIPDRTRANVADQQLNPSMYHFDDGYKFLAPVGSYPAGAGPYGTLDLIGNVAEWVQDWLAGNGYADEGVQSPDVIKNPTGAKSGLGRVERGGAWDAGQEDNGEHLVSWHRNWNKPKSSSDDSGFRCADSH